MSFAIESMTVEQWKERQERGPQTTPVVLRGALSRLLTESWTPECFAALYPDVEVTVAVNLPQEGSPYSHLGEMHYRKMEMRQFLDVLASGASCYLSQAPLQRFPGLLRHVHPSALSLKSIKAVNLWMGGPTRSGLHFDFGDNMFGQVYGSKQFILIAPKHSRFLYQYPDVPSKSRLDPEKPDLTLFPKFANCPIMRCDLAAGDLLFIPKGWWHFVKAEDVSISVNCWHGTSLTWVDFLRLYLSGGPKVVFCWVRDFVWHGLLKRPYKRRLFSPESIGLGAYLRIKRRWAAANHAAAK